MTVAPQKLMDARAYIMSHYGIPGNTLGIVGGPSHFGGYHCGRDRTVAGDYSVNESSRDKNGLSLAASALDIGYGGKFTLKDLQKFSKWLVDECAKGAPDTKDIREVIYSLDGKNVKRWDRLKRRTSGDSSHTFHTHISYFRDSETRDKTALFARYLNGDGMEIKDKVKVPQWAQDRWADLGATITVETALASGYAHARSAKDQVYKNAAELAKLKAIVEALATGGGVDLKKVEAAAEKGAKAALESLSIEIDWSTKE